MSLRYCRTCNQTQQHMITVSINTAKIDKNHLFEGKTGKFLDIALMESKTGKFLDIALMESKSGKDKYGNDGFVTQSISKEARAKGERGPIIGSWKRLEHNPRSQGHPTGNVSKSDDNLF